MAARDEHQRDAADIVRPWRTGRLPPLVGIAAAAEILGINGKTTYAWMAPGSGPFGPDKTRIVAPRRMAVRDDDGEWQQTGWQVWVEDDIEAYARDVGGPRGAPRGPKGSPEPIDWSRELSPAIVHRAWRTPRLPTLVGVVGACQALDVKRVTLHRWMAPGSGRPGVTFGPQATRICPWAEGKALKGPVWVLEDLERFAAQYGRK